MNKAEAITKLIVDNIPLQDAQGFYVDQIETDKVRCVLPYTDSHLRPGNSISGPIIMTLADASMYALILSMDEQQTMAVTQDFQIHFLARPAPQDLVAEIHLLKNGRKNIVMRADIYSANAQGEQKLVAHATGSYARA